MKKEIEEFYNKQDFQIKKLIRRKPKGIHDDSIEKAAEQLYRDIKGGYEIKPIQIPRKIYQMAKMIPGRADQTEEMIKADNKRMKIWMLIFFTWVSIFELIRWLAIC